MRFAAPLAAALGLALLACDSDCEDPQTFLEELECGTPGDEDTVPPFDLWVHVPSMPEWQGRRFVVTVDAEGADRKTWSDRLDGSWAVLEGDYLEPDLSYVLEAWLDADGDGDCDAPPADAAWRIEIVRPERERSVTLHPATATAPYCP